MITDKLLMLLSHMLTNWVNALNNPYLFFMVIIMIVIILSLPTCFNKK
jgi:hypothetical protein